MTELQTLITNYANDKKELDDLKKVCDIENNKIKELMVEAGKIEETAGEYTAKYTVQVRESINEAALLEYAHQNPILRSIIKTKEYADFDVLETLIYKGLLPQDTIMDINRFRETKLIPTLRISKKKKKKN